MELIKSEKERERAIEILEEAFKHSLGIVWLLKRNEKKQVNRFLSFLLEEALINKGAFLTENKNGVVLYTRLQDNTVSIKLTLKKIYIFLFVLGIKNGVKALKYRRIVNEIRPKKGWCGWLVATDTSVIGNEAAYEIKNEMFKKAEETDESVFVETTIKRVKLLYERAGYYEYAQIEHPYEELTVWFMRRDPQKKEI